MSRSGYSDDCENLQLWRGAVKRAMNGYRGQHLLCKLRDALDAMPDKRLIADAIRDEHGGVCALGALDPNAPAYIPDDEEGLSAHALAQHFGIAHALAAEIVYMNDEFYEGRTPEVRWERMRAWVAQQIKPPQADDAVDPHAADPGKLTTREKGL